MAVTTIDRTHYNTLVDDDGSGTTGSSWDKDDVDQMLDAVDGIFANTSGVSFAGPLTANGAVTANGVLSVNGNITANGGLTVSNTVTVNTSSANTQLGPGSASLWSPSPLIDFWDNDEPANGGRFRLIARIGQIEIQSLSDVGSTLSQLWIATRDGNLKVANGLFEHARTVALGAWTGVTYNAASFTAASGTWTVDSGDQVTYAYTLVGKTMTVAFEIQNTDVSATPSELRIAIPGAATAAKKMTANIWGNDANSTNGAVCTAEVAAAGTVIALKRYTSVGAAANWSTTSSDNTSVRGHIVFEIQ